MVRFNIQSNNRTRSDSLANRGGWEKEIVRILPPTPPKVAQDQERHAACRPRRL